MDTWTVSFLPVVASSVINIFEIYPKWYFADDVQSRVEFILAMQDFHWKKWVAQFWLLLCNLTGSDVTLQNRQEKCQSLRSKKYAKEIDNKTFYLHSITCIVILASITTYLEHIKYKLFFNSSNNSSSIERTWCFSPSYPRDGYPGDDDDDAGQLRLSKGLRLAYEVRVSCSQN